MKEFSFPNIPDFIKVNNFDYWGEGCKLLISDKSLNAAKENKLKIMVGVHGFKRNIINFNLEIKAISGNIKIFVGNDNTFVSIGESVRGSFDLRLRRNSKVVIGDRTTANEILIMCDNSEFICGSDCMISDGVLSQGSDQHGIVDLKSGKIINDNYKSTLLGDHVWLGRRCTLAPKSKIGTGSIIGVGSLVTSEIPEYSVAVGVPAKVVKNDVTWCRSIIELDYFSSNAVAGFYREERKESIIGNIEENNNYFKEIHQEYKNVKVIKKKSKLRYTIKKMMIGLIKKFMGQHYKNNSDRLKMILKSFSACWLLY